MALLAYNVNKNIFTEEIYYQLTDDIDLSEHQWIPIARFGWNISEEDDVAQPFNGYFDGNGKTISGLYVDETSTDYYAGLFGGINARGTEEPVVHDLTIKDAIIMASCSNVSQSNAGILCGTCSGSGDVSAIENISVSGTISRKGGGNSISTGGLVGYASNMNISNCSSDVTIGSVAGTTYEGSAGGGLIGTASNTIVTECQSLGSITDGYNLGGLVGYVSGTTSITKCSSAVEVTGDDMGLGGFVGTLKAGTIENCVATGNVKNTMNDKYVSVGGFAGQSEGSITNSHCTGVAESNNPDRPAGGFVGNGAGSTLTCTFSSESNPTLQPVGFNASENNDITGKTTSEVKNAICEGYYGGHDYGSEWIVDQEASCIAEGSKSHHCSHCDAKSEVTAILALGHSAVKTEAKAPTATEVGNIEYWYCSVCNTYFKDAALGQEILQADTVIAATGSPGNGNQPGQSDQTGKPEIKPADNQQGNTVKTGDDNQLMLWSMLLVMGGLGIAMSTYHRVKGK